MSHKVFVVTVISWLFFGIGFASAAEDLAVSKQQALARIRQKDVAGAEQAIAQVKAACESNPAVFSQVLVELAEAWDVRHGRNQAKALFADVVQKYPGSPEAKLLNAVSAATGMIERGQVAEAGEAVDRLYSDCGAHASLRWRLVDLAERWENKGYYERADQLRQRVIKDYPDSPQARMAQLTWDASQLYRKIERRESDSVFEEVSRWERDYKELGETVMWKILGAAGRLNENGGKKLARELYAKLARDYAGTTPGDHGVNYLYHEEICGQIRQGAYDAAQAQIEAMMVRDAGNPDMYELPWRLWDYAKLWETVGQKEHARALYAKLVRDYAGTTPGAHGVNYLHHEEICGQIRQGAYDAAQAQIEAMMARDAGNPDMYELPWRLRDYAYLWEDFGQKDRARALKLRIAANFKGFEHGPELGLQAVRDGIYDLMDQGDQEGVNTAIARMEKAYADHPNPLAHKLLDIANRYEEKGQMDEGTALRELILKDYAKAPAAREAGVILDRNAVCQLIAEGKYEQASQRANAMLAVHDDQGGTPWHLVGLAGQLGEKGQADLARSVYLNLLAAKPDHPATAKAMGELYGALPAIRRWDLAAAESATAKLKYDIAPARLPVTLFWVAEEYYDQGILRVGPDRNEAGLAYLRRAIALFETDVVDRVENQDMKAEAYAQLATSYLALEEYSQAIRYYHLLANQYPKYHRAWHALYMTGEIPRNMANLGLISQEDAASLVRQAFALLLERYPQCPLAGTVRQRLAEMN